MNVFLFAILHIAHVQNNTCEHKTDFTQVLLRHTEAKGLIVAGVNGASHTGRFLSLHQLKTGHQLHLHKRI